MPKMAMKLFSKKQAQIRTNSKSRNETRPLMLGIVGDSGCGKSTLVRGIEQIFGKNRVTQICLDDYHRYDRAERARRGLTALNPAANDLTLMAEHLRRLGQGQRILKPVYDHTTGCFTQPEAVAPRSLVIVHGLFSLFTPELAELFDLSLYLDPEESLRLEWKIARDTHKRGYQLEEVLQQIEERRPDAAAYITPQKSAADLVISFRRPISLLYNRGLLDVKLSPCAGWQWPRLQPEETARSLMIPPGRALEISGRIDQPAALRLARAFGLPSYPAFSALWRNNQPLKDLGLYTSNDGAPSEQRQSLTLALTQWLIAGRLLQPDANLEEAQVA